MQRAGFPNVSIKMYRDYEAFLNSNYHELGATFVSMTIRDTLRGINEGLLQFYDPSAYHTKLTGHEIIQISLTSANTNEVRNRIYGVSHSSVSVDSKGDNILTFQMNSYHKVLNTKFGRSTETNALNNITSMMDAIYKDCPLWKPNLKGVNVFIPKCPWVWGVTEYQEFIRTRGQSVDNESFVYCWEDFDGLTILDHESIIKQEPRIAIVCDPMLYGQYSDMSEYLMVYDFDWQTKSSASTKNAFNNVTYSVLDLKSKQYNKIIVGDGDNAAHFIHGGAYGDMIYKNAHLEGTKLATFGQYDSYASCIAHGNFSIQPGQKYRFFDGKDQMKTDFIVDEVVHEICREQSLTHLHMFSNSEEFKPVNFEGKI